ncbi:MAG: hypothetical protein QW680_00405 [Pyrobaculum sp.]
MKLAVAILLMTFVIFAQNITDPFLKINNIFENILNSINNFLENLKEIIKKYIVSISKTLSIILGLVGAVLYLSGIHKYGGRGMVIGAILLYVFAEFVNSI